MRKIFISGSISSKEIPQEVIKSVDDSRKRNYTILIGDAKGIDKNIQDMLKADNYKNVEVYHVGPLTEGKRNIISALMDEYEIKTAEDIQDALKDLLWGAPSGL